MKIPTRLSMTVKKKDLPNNKEILHKEKENAITGLLYFTERHRNCSPADADVIHYTEDKFKTVVGSDLLLCLIALKTNAMQSALCSTLLIYLKVTTAQICLVKFLCRKDFLVCSLKTKEKRNGRTWDLIEGGTVLHLFHHLLYESQLFIFNTRTWFLMLLTVENAETHLTGSMLC